MIKYDPETESALQDKHKDYVRTKRNQKIVIRSKQAARKAYDKKNDPHIKKSPRLPEPFVGINKRADKKTNKAGRNAAEKFSIRQETKLLADIPGRFPDEKRLDKKHGNQIYQCKIKIFPVLSPLNKNQEK